MKSSIQNIRNPRDLRIQDKKNTELSTLSPTKEYCLDNKFVKQNKIIGKINLLKRF